MSGHDFDDVQAVRSCGYACLRGLPPLAPFARAAAALAGDVACPAWRAMWDLVPNTPASQSRDPEVYVESFPVQPIPRAKDFHCGQFVIRGSFQALCQVGGNGEGDSPDAFVPQF